MKNLKSKVLIIRILEACNAGCFMCDFALSKDKYRFPVFEAQKLIKNIKGTSIKHVRFTGGEPLMHDDIGELIENFRRADIEVSIISNGYFLEEKSTLLNQSGLSQLIISLDGATPKTHNKYRKTKGLFENIVAGIKAIKLLNQNIIIRINSVVGGHNISELNQLYDLLKEMKINQWSIIPLKNQNGVWKSSTKENLWEKYISFQNYVKQNPSNIQFLGHSFQWGGRSKKEFEELWHQNKSITPKPVCHLVDEVLYYIPNKGIVFPCNCLPHRFEENIFWETTTSENFSEVSLSSARNWLRKNGPNKCKGCEPINAALGENLIDLKQDIFGF